MGLSVAQALVARLGIDMSEYQRGMARAPNLAKRAGKAIGTAFKVAAAAMAAVGVAAVALGKKIFDVGSSVLETRSKFNTVFGSARDAVRGFAEEFGTLAGLSRNQAEAVLATTGSIVQGMGFAKGASAEFSMEVVKLAGDLGSFNDVPTAEVAMAIQAAITGEREQLKRLGIVVREADVQQRALLNTGKETVGALTQQEKATATLQIITERAGVAVGDLARTQGSAANRAKQLGAQFQTVKEDLSVAFVPLIAQTVLPMLLNLVGILRDNEARIVAFGMAFIEVGKTIVSVAVNAFQLVGGILGNIGAVIVGIFTADFGLVKAAIIDLKDVTVENVGDMLQSFRDLAANLPQVVAAAQAAPGTGLGAEALTETERMVMQMQEAVPVIAEVKGSLSGLSAPLIKANEKTQEMVGNVKVATGFGAELKQSFSGVADAVGNQVVGGLTAAVLGVQSLGSAIKDVGKAILQQIVGALVQAIIKATILKALMSAFGGPFGFLGFQRGGMISAQRGFTLPQVAPAGFGGGIPVLAHPGEAVLNRQAVERIGGEAGVQQLNRGGGGTGGMLPAPDAGAGPSVHIGTLSFPGITDVDALERRLPAILRRLQEKGRI